MSTKTDRLPIAPTNIVAVGAALVAAGIVAATGNWWSAAILAAAGLYIGWAAWMARRESSTDLHRINALEYRDERDRTLGRSALATVGLAALAVCYVSFIVSIVIGEPALILATCAQLVIIAVVWMIANARAVQRG